MLTATGKSEATVSSYEMEEEDDFDLKFNDEAQTSHYLSLGLTPLSQLSPPDPGTPTGGSSVGGDAYFFPSMPPPVTPISSVFSMSGSGAGVGIPVDDTLVVSNMGMVMPDANPMSEAMNSGVSRRSGGGRKNKHEISSHPPTKLEPVPEQSCSLDDSFDLFYDSHMPKNANNGLGSSSSSAEDPSSTLLQAPAHPSNNELLPTHLRRKTGMRRKSGTRRKQEEEEEIELDSTVLRNRNIPDFEYPVKLGREENFMNQYSPRQEGRRMRSKMREQELLRQKEKLQMKLLEEEHAHLKQQELRAAKIAQDYGATRQREGATDPMQNSGLVLEQAMRFEAQAQLFSSQPKKGNASPQHVPHQPDKIIKTSNQFSVL